MIKIGPYLFPLPECGKEKLLKVSLTYSPPNIYFKEVAYVCVCMYIHLCVHICLLCACLCMCTHAYMCMHVCAYMYVYMCMYIHACAYVCVCTFMHVYVCLCVCMFMCVYIIMWHTSDLWSCHLLLHWSSPKRVGAFI